MGGGGGAGVEAGARRGGVDVMEGEAAGKAFREEGTGGRRWRAGQCRQNCRGSFESWRKR